MDAHSPWASRITREQQVVSSCCTAPSPVIVFHVLPVRADKGGLCHDGIMHLLQLGLEARLGLLWDL